MLLFLILLQTTQQFESRFKNSSNDWKTFIAELNSEIVTNRKHMDDDVSIFRTVYIAWMDVNLDDVKAFF